ncbi:hypothetical protein [Mesorhizobium sp. SP-1A]|uniref:hypothetical protein n=1 Tax=Mesorhizobium sp. SP-1A TaxID=3077840 RepID=UPI0028F6F1C5|nr:hypothetical protein [Mesorhizobium sp. SP-1A]
MTAACRSSLRRWPRTAFSHQDDGETEPAAPFDETTVNERIVFEAVSWRDFRHGPSKRWDNRPWDAFRHTISADDYDGFVDRDLVNVQNEDGTSTASPNECEAWEVWDKRRTRRSAGTLDGFAICTQNRGKSMKTISSIYILAALLALGGCQTTKGSTVRSGRQPQSSRPCPIRKFATRAARFRGSTSRSWRHHRVSDQGRVCAIASYIRLYPVPANRPAPEMGRAVYFDIEAVNRNHCRRRVFGVKAERNPMHNVRRSLEQLRRYIAGCNDRNELQEVDALLGVALEEVRRKIQQKEAREHREVRG